jgi:hypothetical protein
MSRLDVGDKVTWRECVKPHLVELLESLKQRHGPGPFWVVEERSAQAGFDYIDPSNPRTVRFRDANGKISTDFLGTGWFVKARTK